MTARVSPGADPLADAYDHCAALARAHARDQWLGALYASASARGALFALASFDTEIRQALKRAHNPSLAAIRLAWWREAIAGERRDEAAGSPVALALGAAIDAYALPKAWLEAMLDARLQGDRAGATISTSPLFAPSPTRARARACGWRRESRPGGRISIRRTRMRQPAWRWR